MYDSRDIEVLKGKHITKVDGLEKGSDAVYIYTAEGPVYKMHHYQDCCEYVAIEDANVIGDLKGEVLSAYESTEDASDKDDYGELQMYTFYRISTMAGDAFIRWYGSSNGYYGVGVDFELIDGEE